MRSALTPAQAVAHTYMNRSEIEASERCGCYSCFRQFPPSEVALWSDSTDPADEEPGALRADDGKFPGYTAVCPFCEDTSVLGSASGADISDEFLRQVHAYWTRGRNEV
jgi:hypothetical protein